MPNALARESSPYLLQHADNPVAWLPWGEAAFARARAEDKPLFLSIGYSTCHWCHVMAHESFEDAAIAALLNAEFVPVKVDREERPDIDQVYMAYVQAVTGRGGWPLSVWLTPGLKPFYGGTYFPPDDRPGHPGLPAILRAIARAWREERPALVAEGERVLAALAEDRPPAVGETTLAEAASEAFEKGFQHFQAAFDAGQGGFGGAPKFPRASVLHFLLRCAALQGRDSEAGREALGMAARTLEAMARGGIHDHAGGGFHRYAVDAAWFLPHFEKMLYDQAQIALNALEVRAATGDERFGWLARDILGYVARDLTGPHGEFYAAEDADSAAPGEPGRHGEGAFYVWTRQEIEAVLSAVPDGGRTVALVCRHFGIADGGNVPAELDPRGEFTGMNVLAQRAPLAVTAAAAGLEPQEANDRVSSALGRLRQTRLARPRPHRDDKVVTAWNGLMISAFARGDGAAAAARAAEFIRRELHDPSSGVLFRAYRGGRGKVEGFAEDYAFLIQGLLDLYEAAFDPGWLQWAERLQRKMDELFWDSEGGGWFTSGPAHTGVLLRLKQEYDGAEPASNSVAALNGLRLAAMLHAEEYRTRALRTLEAFRPRWTAAPHALPEMLCALELALEPPRHVVLAGDPAAEDFRALAAVVREVHGPWRALLAADGGAGQAWLATRAPWLAAIAPREGRAAAYVCENFTCQAPVTSVGELRTLL